MKSTVTKELQDTVRALGWPEVHFDAKGNHYANVHELPSALDSEDLSLYGTGIVAASQLIPGLNPDGIREPVIIGNPETKIVETVKAKEILAAKTVDSAPSILDQLLSMSAEDKAKIAALLASDPTPTPAPPPSK